MRRAPALVCLLALTACGDLPRPFRHVATNPLVDPMPLAGVTVVPVIDVPDPQQLAEVMAAALVAEDVAATPGKPRPGGRSVGATVADDGAWVLVTWQLRGPDGTLLAQDVQRHTRAAWAAEEGRAASAAGAAAALARSLRGEAAVVSAPRLAVPPVAGAPGDGAAALAAAMSKALRRAGAVVTDDAPEFTVAGAVTLSPGPAGHEQVAVTWTVRGPDNAIVGTISQANPVPKQQVHGVWGSLAGMIAEAAAGGIVEVVRGTSR